MAFNQHVDSVVTNFSDSGEIQRLLEKIARLRAKHAKNLIRMKTKHQSLLQAMQRSQNVCFTIKLFEEACKKRSEATEKKRINVKKIVEFKDFKKTVESAAAQLDAEGNGPANGAAHDEDLIMDGIEETGGEIFSLYDPWSKALMKNPLRNSMCGHIYDRDSVMLIIKDNIGIRCPVLGCANKTYIQPGHLVEDAIVRQKVQQRMAEENEDDSSSEEDED